MKKIIILLLSAVVLLFGVISYGNAENNMEHRASTIFTSTSAVLKSDKRCIYNCSTKNSCNSLSISSCYLECYISGEWVRISTLTPPSLVVSGTAYTYSANYSSNIGTGRYRVWVTFNADGHTKTFCSNEQTY